MPDINLASRRLVAARAGFAVAFFAVSLGVAEAKVSHGSCGVGSERLKASTTYQNSGSSSYKVTRVSWNIDNSHPNSPAKNNMYVALRGYSGNQQYWARTSGDNVREGNGYWNLPGGGVTVPRAGKPYVKYIATFDIKNASDPTCFTYTNL